MENATSLYILQDFMIRTQHDRTAEELVCEFQDAIKIRDASLQCAQDDDSEAAWNDEVHSRVLKLALETCSQVGYKNMYVIIVLLSSSSSFLLTRPAPSLGSNPRSLSRNMSVGASSSQRWLTTLCISLQTSTCRLPYQRNSNRNLENSNQSTRQSTALFASDQSLSASRRKQPTLSSKQRRCSWPSGVPRILPASKTLLVRRGRLQH